MGVKVANGISSENTNHIPSPKFMHMCTSRKGLYQSCKKELLNLKFLTVDKFGGIFFFGGLVGFFFAYTMVVNGEL